MDTLPMEIVEMIAQNLTAAELAGCAAVCHQWRELFNSDNLWKPRCNSALEETLRTTPCVVEPPFVSPEVKSSTLCPVGKWRLAYMRETHLWNNWQLGNYKMVTVPSESMCHTFFITDYLVVRIYNSMTSAHGRRDVSSRIKLYDLKIFPPTLLQEIPDEHFGRVEGTYYSNNKLVIFYENYEKVHFMSLFNLSMNGENILTFKFKICLPVEKLSDGNSTEPRFVIPHYTIFGYDQIRYYPSAQIGNSTVPGFVITHNTIFGYDPIRSSAQNLHIWDLDQGTELKVEKSPLDKPYGFSDIITSKTSDDVIVVVSNYVNCEPFVLCNHEPCEEIIVTYNFRVYNSSKLKYLPFTEQFESEHHIRYNCKIHLDYVAIACNGNLKIYNYKYPNLLAEESIRMIELPNTLKISSLEVIDNCFAFITDHTFRMFHPTSQTFLALVDLQVENFSIISDSLVKFTMKLTSPEIWKIGRFCQRNLRVCLSEEDKTNESSTRVFQTDLSGYGFELVSSHLGVSIESFFKRMNLTKLYYYW